MLFRSHFFLKSDISSSDKHKILVPAEADDCKKFQESDQNSYENEKMTSHLITNNDFFSQDVNDTYHLSIGNDFGTQMYYFAITFEATTTTEATTTAGTTTITTTTATNNGTDGNTFFNYILTLTASIFESGPTPTP